MPCLRASEVDYHIDRERFQAGKAILGQMDDTQDRCQKHVLVLSPNYRASKYCCHELKRAVAVDPQFKNGHVIPIMRVKCILPARFSKPNPLYVFLRKDNDDSQWKLLFDGLKTDLRSPAPHWLDALADVCRHLRRGESVNLVVKGKPRWRELITELQTTHLPDLVAVDLQSPATTTRSGLIGQMLQASGSRSPVPDEPRDLPHLGKIIEGRSLTMLARTRFDLVEARPHYGVDLFASLRYLMMEERKLVLLIQSRDYFANLLPANHPLSEIDIRTVELCETP